MKFRAVVLALVIALGIGCLPVPGTQGVHVGVYRNSVYHYSIKVPQGLECRTTPPPAPQHGCRIVVRDGAEIWWDGSYAPDPEMSDTDVMDHFISMERDVAASEGYIEVSRRQARGRMGTRSVVEYTTGDGRPGIGAKSCHLSRLLVRPGDPSVLYIIQLRTRGEPTDDDVKIFNSIAGSFRLQATRKGLRRGLR